MKCKLVATVAGLALMGTAASAQTTIEMTTAFGQNLPILGTAAVDFTNRINAISNEVEVERYTRYQELMGWLLIPALGLVVSETFLRKTIFRKLP